MGVTFIAKEGTYTAPATLTTKTITENGTYSAVDDSANGYSSVTVNVEGGGGSSDFSTAEVTIVNNSSDNQVSVSAVTINNNDKLESVFLGVSEYTNDKINVLLYKGVSAGIDVSHGSSVISTTGNITYDEQTFMYYATGDCTITIS